ncbi:MAG: hypothetical protein GX600_02045 [Dehalococcoidia bacterium]|nr:hypothetical protein [Dehalococcoidia bacterium]
MFAVSERWRATYPDGMVAAVVIHDAKNVAAHAELDARKRALEANIASRYLSAEDVKSARNIQPYVAYYKRFGKTYHVLQQLRTVALKGATLPTVSGLVDVMFIAEMKHLLLTAGHDLNTVSPPVILDAAAGTEAYTKLNQESQVAKESDMMVIDAQGVLSSIIHGPDYRSRITLETSDVMYIVYAPSGIIRDEVMHHVRDIVAGVLAFATQARVEPVRLLTAAGVAEVAW